MFNFHGSIGCVAIFVWSLLVLASYLSASLVTQSTPLSSWKIVCPFVCPLVVLVYCFLGSVCPFVGLVWSFVSPFVVFKVLSAGFFYNWSIRWAINYIKDFVLLSLFAISIDSNWLSWLKTLHCFTIHAKIVLFYVAKRFMYKNS